MYEIQRPKGLRRVWIVATKKDSSRAREDFPTAVKSIQKILQSGEKNEQDVNTSSDESSSIQVWEPLDKQRIVEDTV